MRFFLTLGMILLAGATARAETFSFSFGGQSIQIGISAGCNDMSCVSVNVPGYYSRGAASSEPRRAARTQAAREQEPKRAGKPKPVKTVAEPQVAAVPTKPTAEPQAAIPSAPAKAAMVSEPAPAAPVTRSLAPVAAPVAAPVPVETPKAAAEPAPAVAIAPIPEQLTPEPPVVAEAPAAPIAAAPPAEVATAPAVPAAASEPETKSMVIAALPPTKPAAEDTAKPAAPQPFGMWSGRDGQLKIEACGQYLCGYAAGGKHAGKMILINMKQTKANHWSGRVRDFSSGGVYSASMFMRGTNLLRIQGCAFGGMICDGRTLARAD